MEDLWLRQSVHGWVLFLGIKSVYSDKSKRNYRGKCLGWPVTSYGGGSLSFSAKWEPYAVTEPSHGSKLRISPEISVSVSISSPRSEAMSKYKLPACFDRNWSNNGCSGQWPRLTTNNAQSITVSDKGSLGHTDADEFLAFPQVTQA